jgi:hypothetical protein
LPFINHHAASLDLLKVTDGKKIARINTVNYNQLCLLVLYI